MTVLDELERFEPFSKLSNQGKTLLAQGALRKECGKSTIALIKGQAVSGAYVVLSGRLRVFTHTPGGTEATLYFINPGETCVLALNCLFNDSCTPHGFRLKKRPPFRLFRARFIGNCSSAKRPFRT
jgi:CRP/FNR family transcriptional regulator